MSQPADDRIYAANPRIVADDFGEETVLINVEKGLYFSMQGSAPDIWRAFATPRPLAATVASLAAELDDAAQEELGRIARLMVEHELLIEGEAPAESGAPLRSLAALSFTAPVLGVFNDLAELIAIDPVHEVEESSGWPVRPASFPDVA